MAYHNGLFVSGRDNAIKERFIMKTAYLTDIRKVEIRESEAPRVESDTDVLLEVETVGVCGSDMHYYRTGRIGELVVEYPFIVGHEFVGHVREVGRVVTNLKVGDRVAVDPLIWCGKCDEFFEAYRSKTVLRDEGEGAGETWPPMNEIGFVKAPGGEWMAAGTEEAKKLQREFKCPYCGNDDRSTLHPSSPE